MAVEKKLMRFKDIIDRKDFTYISDPEAIKNIAKIFKLVNYMVISDIDGSIQSLEAYCKLHSPKGLCVN